MISTIDRLVDGEHYRQCFKQELWDSLNAECAQLLPAFKALYAGLDVAFSIRCVAYHRPAGAVGDLTPHVHVVHEWLSKPNSPLRSCIEMFSAGGLFYAAQCHEKGTRAWLSAGGGSEQGMRAAAMALQSMHNEVQVLIIL